MSRLDALTRDLNPAQREAALHRDGPLLVLAGAGAGKTKTAIHRLAALLATGIAPHQILCITFTNKAAREMRERAEALVGESAKEVMIRTFHSAAMILLRQYVERYPKAGRDKNFGIADPSAQLALVKEAIAERNFDLKANKPESFLWRIGRFKNELADPDSLLYRQATNPLMDWPRVQALIADSDRYVNRLTAEIWRRYEEKLRQNNLFDFDDLIGTFVRMLTDEPGIRADLQHRFRYIQVDEFQDTNIAQLQMVRQLAGERNNVMAVGDDAQSIYAWRSADIRCILQFEQFFPGAQIVKLEQNYRSTATILAAANRVIQFNPEQIPKVLFSEKGEGWPIQLYEADSGEDEARYVITEIKKGVAAGRPYKHYAILYRTNAQARPFEERLREEQIPYQVVGGPTFYDRKEVQDTLAYLKLLVNPRDSVACERVLNAPKRGIGERGFQKILALAAQRDASLIDALAMAADEGVVVENGARGALDLYHLYKEARQLRQAGKDWQAVDLLVQGSGLMRHLEAEDKSKEERRADNVRAVLTGMHEWGRRWKKEDLAGYLDRLSLQDSQDDATGDDVVRLQTIHSSKGLEYPVVFVVGLEHGLLPNRRALDEGAISEERRLAYVAITRARELLYLTNAKIRASGSNFSITTPSVFLSEALHGVSPPLPE
ncbi:MAG TPA: UvrD-helicase domain-containing protein [Symbiobacteriaceae bacterium]|nr:UvrD-helicase domain-containing protein [Symbiobacteriaceae bacterium]